MRTKHFAPPEQSSWGAADEHGNLQRGFLSVEKLEHGVIDGNFGSESLRSTSVMVIIVDKSAGDPAPLQVSQIPGGVTLGLASVVGSRGTRSVLKIWPELLLQSNLARQPGKQPAVDSGTDTHTATTTIRTYGRKFLSLAHGVTCQAALVAPPRTVYFVCGLTQLALATSCDDPTVISSPCVSLGTSPKQMSCRRLALGIGTPPPSMQIRHSPSWKVSRDHPDQRSIFNPIRIPQGRPSSPSNAMFGMNQHPARQRDMSGASITKTV